MRKYLLTLAALGLAGLLVVVDGNSALGLGGKKSDQEKFQGTWSVVSFEAGGKKAPTELFKDVKLIIVGNKGTFKLPKGEDETSTYALDPKKKPKTIDITSTSGKEKGKKSLGIYTFVDADTFKIAMADVGDRPTEFVTKKDSKFQVMTFKRAK